MYLVRVPSFEPDPQVDLRAEGSLEERWFAPDELGTLPTRPVDLGEIVSCTSDW
jgi:hypothetical protein